MKPTARFALALQPCHAPPRPLRSRLLVDGRDAHLELPGWRMRFQAELDEGYLLVTDLGGRGEDTIVLQLLDHGLRQLAWRALGPLFTLFAAEHRPCRLQSVSPLGPRTLRLTAKDGRSWVLEVRGRGIPLLYPRLALAAL